MDIKIRKKIVLLVIFATFKPIFTAGGGIKQALRISCIENGRFYRDVSTPAGKKLTSIECSKYFLCLDGEVFDFRCSNGLHFDVERQICDAKQNVHNCDISTGIESNIPKGEKAQGEEKKAAKCATNDPNARSEACLDGTCLPADYFCDGSIDCADGSDEENCLTTNDANSAPECNQTCKLPDCFCSKYGIEIPGQIPPEKTPQMIVLTFDDAINHENFDVFEELLHRDEGFRNPNGCPIKATFFVSHQHNNYHHTQILWNRGHEIAVHSISHRSPDSWWASNATLEDFFDEMVGEANILHRYANIRLSEIRGLRVPFLSPGWNRQFLMMKEFGFVYDSSIVAPFSDPPLWPYTLDHRIPHACAHCPTRPYPGVYELVLNQLEHGAYTCAMADACPSSLGGEDVFKMLVHNFRRHYLTNRAPFGLYFHAGWFTRADYMRAFKRFLGEVLQREDVWFVTGSQLIEWMRKPVAIEELARFEPWGCKKRGFERREVACKVPNACRLFSAFFGQFRYMYTCAECPDYYPWVRNEFGVE